MKYPGFPPKQTWWAGSRLAPSRNKPGALFQGLDFSWGEARGGFCFAMPVVAEGSVPGRGPPGTGVAQRCGEAAELGVDGVQGGGARCAPQPRERVPLPGAGLWARRRGGGGCAGRRAGPGAAAAFRRFAWWTAPSGDSNRWQRCRFGTARLLPAAAEAALGHLRRALGGGRREAERGRKKPKGFVAARQSVALHSRSRPKCECVSVSVWLCVIVCVVRVRAPRGQIRAFSPASHQPEWLSGWPGYFCINSAAAVSSQALRGSQGTKPLSLPEATLFPRCWGGSLWGSSPPVHDGLHSFSHWHFCILLL